MRPAIWQGRPQEDMHLKKWGSWKEKVFCKVELKTSRKIKTRSWQGTKMDSFREKKTTASALRYVDTLDTLSIFFGETRNVGYASRDYMKRLRKRVERENGDI